MLRKMIFAFAVLVLAGSAMAADHTGVKRYPGARYDEQWSMRQAELAVASGGGSSACYLTADPVQKIVTFYEADGFKAIGTATNDSARLQRGAGASITLKNLKSPKGAAETRICVVKQ